MAKRRETGSLAGAFARGPRTEVDFLLPPRPAAPAVVEAAPVEPPAPVRFAIDDVRDPVGLDELTGFEPTSPAEPEAPVSRFTTDTVVVEATTDARPLTSSVTLSRAALARAVPVADDTPVVQVRLRPTIEAPLVSRPAALDPWTPTPVRRTIDIDPRPAPESWSPASPPLPGRRGGRLRRAIARVLRFVLAMA